MAVDCKDNGPTKKTAYTHRQRQIPNQECFQKSLIQWSLCTDLDVAAQYSRTTLSFVFRFPSKVAISELSTTKSFSAYVI